MILFRYVCSKLQILSTPKPFVGMKKIFIIFTILATCFTTQAQTVGLVLSGGGAKGIAHVGLIKALEENNIPIDYITGTSMGAIVGALYAMGYTPDEMMQVFNSQEFLNWAFGIISKEDLYYFMLPEESPEIVKFNLGTLKPDTTHNPTNLLNRIIPESVINPMPMNFAFMELFAPYTAQCGGDFNNLYVPYRAIAANVNKKRKEIFASGSLGDAVRASMTIPVAFKPITINDDLMYDGGLHENFPVATMESEFHPDFMIGSVLATKDTTEKPLKEQNIVSQLLTYIMDDNDYTIAPEKGIVVTCPVQDYTMFDFGKAQPIYEQGYKIGLEMADSIKSRINREMTAETRNINRRNFKSRTPKLIFDDVTVTGVNPGDAEYIERQFNSKDSLLSIDDAYKGFIRSISTQKIADLIPHAIYNPETKRYNLQIKAESKEGFSVGIGAFISTYNANSVYLGAHYRTLSMNSLNLDAGIYLGQSYNAGMLSGRIDVGHRIPMYLKLLIVGQNHDFDEKSKLFYDFNTPTFISDNENFAKISFGLPIANRAKMEFNAGYGYIIDRYFQSNYIDYGTESKNKSTYSMGLASAHIESNWLDNPTYPTHGALFKATISYIYGTEKYIPTLDTFTPSQKIHNYFQLTALAHYYLPFKGPIALGLRGEIAYNNNSFCENYTATMIQAPAFTPTPFTHNSFNTGMRANQFIAAGILPIWKITKVLQLRTEFYGFLPIRNIYETSNNMAAYDKPFNQINFFGEASLVYNLPFASLSIYANYGNAPKSQWNFGITLGRQFFAPRFIN